MKEAYDVIVVGAGPAGLLAAKALAQNGFSAVVLERKKDLAAVHRTCGQSLLPPNEYFFGDLFHYAEQGKKFCFVESGLSFPYTGPVKNLYTWRMFSPGMNVMQFGSPEQTQAPIALSYDKEVMLQCLLKDVEALGVDVVGEAECTDIVFQGPVIAVQAGGRTVTGSFVIAADGTNSRVVEKIGYNANRRHIANLYVKSCFVSGFSPPHEESIITGIVYVDAKPVYLFLLPRPEGDAWNFLILTFEPSVDLDEVYRKVLGDSPFSGWFAGAESIRDFAAIESIYSPIIKPFKNNVVVTGDAGSCQELECLGAMITGWRAGLAVAGALKEQQLGIPPKAIQNYQDWWLNTYIKRYDYQDYLSVFGIAYIFSQPDIVDYIFGLMPEPFPPTFNPYTAVGLLGQRLQSLMPKIMQERPDILQQLAGKMLAFPSDLLSNTLAP